MVKIPSIARGEVTVRCTTMGGGSMVRAVHELDLLEMAYDIGIALRPAKRPEGLCVVIDRSASSTA